MKYEIKYFDKQKLRKREVIDCLNPISVAQSSGQLWCQGGKYCGYSYKPMKVMINRKTV